MAEAAAKSMLGTISRGHLECPICCCRFTDPKMLDCLHSFCLNCLDELISSQSPNADKIPCPVCRRGTAVPDTGLQGLPNCFFLSSLVDEFNKQEQLLGHASADAQTCEVCSEGLEAVWECLDCCKIICRKCKKAHKRKKSTRHHQITGKEQNRVDVTPMAPRKKDTPKCNKHTNQDLCFYCETCKILACGKCAALDHRTAEHKYREVGDAIRSYRQDVGKIRQRFHKRRKEFKVADASLTHARNRLRIMVARACKDITAKEEEEIAKIRHKSRLLRDKVTQIGEERDRKFEEIQKRNRDQMEQAEQIVATVDELMRQADDFELLDLKPKVMHNLKFEGELKLENAQHELSFIGVKCRSVVADTELGKVLEKEKWQLKKQFRERGLDDETFECALGVTCLSNGDIAVIDNDNIKQQLIMFTPSGEYKACAGMRRLDDPRGVAVTSDDLLLVTDKQHVKVFDSSLNFIRQFAPSQGDADVDSESELLRDIVVDEKNQIAVLDIGRKVISLRQLDGSLITTIPHDMVGNNLAIGIRERLIFTNYRESKLICTTYMGNEVFNVSTSFNGEPVQPYGVCCDNAGDIYVCVDYYTEELKGSEVHHYSPEGVFIGQVAHGLLDPRGLTFTPSGDLLVADQVSVKIFQRV